MKNLSVIFVCLPFLWLNAQETAPDILTFEEYMGYVKKFHPVAVQANLQVNQGEAELMRARGGFDPKIEVDYATKKFKGNEYYTILNSTFKIPTWYGIDLKAGFEQNEGIYLNPERTVPEQGLLSAGVSFNADEIFMNGRMAAVRSAKAFVKQTVAEKDLMINQILYEASVTYFNWFRMHQEVSVYAEFVENAEARLRGIKTRARLGDAAAIDTVEAKIVLQERKLRFAQSKLNLAKQRLQVSNFLWLANNVPVELKEQMKPEPNLFGKVDDVLQIPQEFSGEVLWDNHPKLRSLSFKRDMLEVERRLKSNSILPDIRLDYNFISPEAEQLAQFNSDNYKAGVSVSFPLFLRKERGDLRLAEIKIQDADLDIRFTERQLKNKLEVIQQEITSYKDQNALISDMVENYIILLAGEERVFSFGESSIFLINSRESKLIEAQLKQIETIFKLLEAKARYFQNLGIVIEG